MCLLFFLICFSLPVPLLSVSADCCFQTSHVRYCESQSLIYSKRHVFLKPRLINSICYLCSLISKLFERKRNKTAIHLSSPFFQANSNNKKWEFTVIIMTSSRLCQHRYTHALNNNSKVVFFSNSFIFFAHFCFNSFLTIKRKSREKKERVIQKNEKNNKKSRPHRYRQRFINCRCWDERRRENIKMIR